MLRAAACAASSLSGLLLLLACTVPAGAADAASAATAYEPYEQMAPSADGIGKRYMGREIAQVMGWQGAAWLEREEREREERTDLLLPRRALPAHHPRDLAAHVALADAVGAG